MENIIMINGSIQMAIIPENESDRDLFLKLSDQGPLEVVFNSHPIGLLDKSVKDCFIIRKKTSSENDQSKA
jgi:hypothetical protein